MSLDLESVTDSATYVSQSAITTVNIGELHFETGGYLPKVELAYETWGTLNAEKSNAILIQHALTGDTHVASSQLSPEAGWWEYLIGPGKPSTPISGLSSPSIWSVVATDQPDHPH